MLANLGENLSASSGRVTLLAVTAAVLAFAIFRIYREYQTYGTLQFVGAATKGTAAVSGALLVWQVFHASQPFAPAPARELAIVLGNTENTPRPSLGTEATDLIEQSLMLHKGEDAEQVLSSIALVSATAPPDVLTVDADRTKFVAMSTNSTRIKRDARDNVRALRAFLDAQQPQANGASYLEAIIEASRNIGTGATITVIGSGLSDDGDLDFAGGDLLTSEKRRAAAIARISEKYGRDYLRGYTVYFVGLGDTVAPQEELSPKQKDIVREVYRETVRGLGGRAQISTKTQVGESIKTKFSVSTTDTGCGNVDYSLDSRTLEFVSDQAAFVSPSKARAALQRVVRVYEDDPGRVKRIDVNGFIYLNPEQRKLARSSDEPLSGARANAVRDLLVREGIPASKIRAVGKGAGPHNNTDKPGLDRKVDIKITRTPNPDC